jgi:hypothetical protein
MRIFSKPPKEPKNEFFNMNANEIIEKQIAFPSHEGQHPLFKKFGVRTGGICDQWLLNENWRQFSETEKWKYIALCALYWKSQYQYWYDRKEYEQYLNYKKAINSET